jgi:predicted metal-dependent enzyme (double-stranded beta helix superfamily)
VAGQLRQHLPSPDLLTAEHRSQPDRSQHVGDVGGFAPPGDIHRVHNSADTTAISIHIYGTDVTRTGSSVRRYYD